MKKNNTAEKAALNAEKITKALQESTEKTLRNIINEAISKVVNESEDVPEDSEDDSYDVQDVEPNETPEVSDVETGEDTGSEEGGEEVAPESGEEGGEEDFDSSEADDDWSDLEQYKIGDDDYDFTGVDGDEILKVYNKLGDDDQIFVKKEDDGTYSVKDDETGAEFVIELNPENLDAEEEPAENEPSDFDLELDGEDADSENAEGEDFGGEDFGGEESEIPAEDDDEIEIDINDDDDEDELNEDLGYTDSYQKDVFDKKLNVNEPADSKTTYSMDAGAPKGAEKPWAGKGNPKPFGEKKDTVDECGINGVDPNAEANLEEDGSGQNTKRAMKKSTNHINRGVHNQRVASQDGEYKGLKTDVNESIKKIVEKAKAIQAENKQYKENLDRIKKSLYEAAVLNVNMGRLVDILVNETTTKDEKKSILERFNNVRTINEGKALHATIKTELRESKKTSSPIVEKQFVTGQQSLNETTIYSNTNDPSLDLMNRMDNLYK